MALAWSLVDCLSWCHPERWRLHCLPVDCYSWSKLLPAIAHDLQLSCDGLQLTCGGVTNFYCEFFHLIPISFFIIRRISSKMSAILFNCSLSIIYLSCFYPTF